MSLTNLPPGFPRAPKARGEVAEVRFVAKALSLGFTVAKPFGDSAPFDFVVCVQGKLWKVQVKSCWALSSAGYYQFAAAVDCFANRRRLPPYGTRPYRADEIDFLVAYVAPEDAWFVIPSDFFVDRCRFCISARLTGMCASYREAWHLLFPQEKAQEPAVTGACFKNSLG